MIGEKCRIKLCPCPAPQYFIHAYVWCDDYEGQLAHSCQHGKGLHHIKICITKTDNEPIVYAKIEKQAGPKPRVSYSFIIVRIHILPTIWQQ